MASSINTQGAAPVKPLDNSQVSKTFSGIGNFFSNTVPKAFGAVNQGQQANQTAQQSGGVYQPNTQQGSGGMSIAPSTPLKSTTFPDGTKHEFHAPTEGSQMSQSGMLPGTDFQKNLGNVLNQSQLNNNPEYQALGQQQNKLVQAQQTGLLAPYADKGQSLGQSYANLSRPQSTGNLAGELGSFNTQAGIQLQGNAQEAQRLLQGGQLATQGAEAVAGLTAPQPYGITTTPYNPGSNTFGTLPGGAQGATGAGIVQGQIQAGQQFAQNSATINKALQGELPGLNKAIADNNFNPSSVTGMNALNQWVQSGLSNSSIPEITGALNSVIGALSSTLGVPSSGSSDFRLGMASSIVDQLQKGSSISDAINFAANQAVTANQAYLGGAQGASNPANQTGQTSAGGYGFQLVNGKWVPQ